MRLKSGRILWNVGLSVFISFVFSLVYIKQANDLCLRTLHMSLCLSDCLVAIRHSEFFFFLMPIIFVLVCYYSNRELFYDQFAIRLRNMKKIWTIQIKSILWLSLLYSSVFCGTGLVVGLFHTNLFYNWDQIESVCYEMRWRLPNPTVKVNPIFIFPVSLVSTVFILLLYGILFFLITWHFTKPVGGFLICLAIIASDYVTYRNEIFVLPNGFISIDYWNWNIYTPIRLLIVCSVIICLCWLGLKVVRKKEFL